MKIIGFAQMHEEQRKGNLIPWFESMNRVCDEIYIVDQGSQDHSAVEYLKHEHVHVRYNTTNDFSNELIHKARLLELVKRDHPDASWVFWMDGDTVLDARLTRQTLRAELGAVRGYGGVKLGHLNLWRSDTHYRTDNKFHALNDAGVCCFWRMSPGLKLSAAPGLHGVQYPKHRSWTRLDYYLLHRGFASDESLIEKLKNYRAIEGVEAFNTKYARFFGDETLALAAIPLGCYPRDLEMRAQCSQERFRDVWEAAQ